MKVPRDLRQQILERAGLAPPKARRARRPTAAVAAPAGPLVALDPSSSRTGYAAFDAAGRLLDFGAYEPRRRDSLFLRSMATADWASGVAERFAPAVVVVEVCSGQTYHAARAGKLTALGYCQGMLLRAVAQAVGRDRVVTVDERAWTGGRRKKDRGSDMRLRFPSYAAVAATGGDEGLDIADSLGLAVWHFARMGVAI